VEIENLKSEEYGEQYKDHLLEQWKTCVEMANCNSERRISTNNVYITVNAAIIALISFTFDYKSILLSMVGAIVSILWLNSIISYKKLNSVKYQIINEIEKSCPYLHMPMNGHCLEIIKSIGDLHIWNEFFHGFLLSST